MKGFTIAEQNKFKRKPLLSLYAFVLSVYSNASYTQSKWNWSVRQSVDWLDCSVFLTIPAVAWHKRYIYLALR